jgi:hypothetical protein
VQPVCSSGRHAVGGVEVEVTQNRRPLKPGTVRLQDSPLGQMSVPGNGQMRRQTFLLSVFVLKHPSSSPQSSPVCASAVGTGVQVSPSDLLPLLPHPSDKLEPFRSAEHFWPLEQPVLSNGLQGE